MPAAVTSHCVTVYLIALMQLCWSYFVVLIIALLAHPQYLDIQGKLVLY